ncbi:MAG: class I SAM-dependent methyltransferase [Bryobacterales bacterium]|nr:class I SAM-dependent methyltransferase [Bryobacterales bacterium]
MRESAAPFVRAYLRQAPLFMAIVRGVECAILREAKPVTEPVLDLGCGDGLFASLAWEHRPTVGMDPSFAALKEAQLRGAHEALVCGSATELPFREGAFATVVCNSVLEHIPDLDAALRECHRAMMHGGRLLITSPSERFGEMLLGARVLSGIGLRRTGAGYARWFNAHSLHYHTLALHEWRRRLETAGFRVREEWHYLDGAAHATFDLMHYLSGWRWIHRKLTGRWCGAWAPFNHLWASWFEKLTADRWPAETGPYLYLDAERDDG